MTPHWKDEIKKPWEGICSKSCWFAKGERCTCKCGGKHHGEGVKPNEKQTKLAKTMEET